MIILGNVSVWIYEGNKKVREGLLKQNGSVQSSEFFKENGYHELPLLCLGDGHALDNMSCGVQIFESISRLKYPYLIEIYLNAGIVSEVAIADFPGLIRLLDGLNPIIICGEKQEARGKIQISIKCQKRLALLPGNPRARPELPDDIFRVLAEKYGLILLVHGG